MKEIKVKKITPIEDSVDAYQFLNNSIDDFLKNTSFDKDKFYPATISEYGNDDCNNDIGAVIFSILTIINLILFKSNINIFLSLISLFSSIYLFYLFISNTCFGFIVNKIVKKIKKDHINLFYPLKNDEIITIIKENYSKKDIILEKMEYRAINQFEVNKIIKNGNPKIINDNIDLIDEIIYIFKRNFSKTMLKKEKEIIENQKEVIDIVNSPDFLENKYFNVEYGVENGPLLQEYLDGDKKDIIDYINNKCLEEYNRKSSFINIKN